MVDVLPPLHQFALLGEVYNCRQCRQTSELLFISGAVQISGLALIPFTVQMQTLVIKVSAHMRVNQ